MAFFVLKGHYHVTQTVLPDMVAQRWGRIINFSSVAAQAGAFRMVHYAAAKGGVIAMTRSLAMELGPCGITVNAVAPGLINTAMSQRAIEGRQFVMPVAQLVRTFPIPRMGEPGIVRATVDMPRLLEQPSGYWTHNNARPVIVRATPEAMPTPLMPARDASP